MRNKTQQLALAISAIGFLWLLVLPWVANQPSMKSHIQWLDDKGIDPSATYYTELEVMDEILARHR